MFKRLLLLSVLAAVAAFAQTTGSITISGSIPDAVSITNDTATAVSSTITMGALTPANTTSLTTWTPIDVRIRSNKQFRLSASATFSVSGAGSDDGGSAITAGDIGFGITAKDDTGALVVDTGARTDTIASKFDYITTSFASLTATNGLTPFVSGTHGTLADLSSSTQLVQGKRVSVKGNLATSTNFLKLSFGVATLPQYFTPNTGFSSTVTLTVATF